eukprot:5116274-Pyramimonas_sp.AAC.2
MSLFCNDGSSFTYAQEARKLAKANGITARPDTKHRSTEDESKHRRRSDEEGASPSSSGQQRGRLPSELPESVFPAFLRKGYIQVLPENTNREPSNILF